MDPRKISPGGSAAGRRTGDRRRTCKIPRRIQWFFFLCTVSRSRDRSLFESWPVTRGHCSQRQHRPLRVVRRRRSGLVQAVAALALPPDGLVVGERGDLVGRGARPGPRPRGGGRRPGRPRRQRGHLHGRARAALVALAPAARRARPQPHLLLPHRRPAAAAALHHRQRHVTHRATKSEPRETEAGRSSEIDR